MSLQKIIFSRRFGMLIDELTSSKYDKGHYVSQLSAAERDKNVTCDIRPINCTRLTDNHITVHSVTPFPFLYGTIVEASDGGA